MWGSALWQPTVLRDWHSSGHEEAGREGESLLVSVDAIHPKQARDRASSRAWLVGGLPGLFLKGQLLCWGQVPSLSLKGLARGWVSIE